MISSRSTAVPASRNSLITGDSVRQVSRPRRFPDRRSHCSARCPFISGDLRSIARRGLETRAEPATASLGGVWRPAPTSLSLATRHSKHSPLLYSPDKESLRYHVHNRRTHEHGVHIHGLVRGRVEQGAGFQLAVDVDDHRPVGRAQPRIGLGRGDLLDLVPVAALGGQVVPLAVVQQVRNAAGIGIRCSRTSENEPRPSPASARRSRRRSSHQP